MAKTISELKNQSIQVRDASAAGENTATRVGTVLNDIVGHIEDYENTQSSKNSSQDAKIDGVKSSLNAEIARAKTEESNLSTQIGTERTERQAAVSKEETARIQADNAEKTARQQADNAEQDARIKADNAEKTARENADITLRTMIQTEVSDREKAVADEAARAKAAEQANTQAIADENARAMAAEEAETTRATTEEERLQGEINNTNTNVETLENKVNSNHDHLTDEVARLDTTDNEIKADLEAEKAAIMGTDRIADGAITTEKVADRAVTYDKLQPEIKEVVEGITYTENTEFIYLKKDADDRLLWWIYPDGSVDWAKGVPAPIQEELKKLEQKIKDNTEGDESVVARVTANETSIVTINKALDDYKVEVAEALSKKRDGEYIDNSEFIDVTKDADGRILECTKPDGSHYIHNVESETIPTEFHNIDDKEGRIDVKTDADGRILRYTKPDGKTVFNAGIESPEIDKINEEINNLSFNEIQSIKELDAQRYGAEYKGTFSLLTNTNYYVTVEDIVTGNKGWLQSIGIYASAGTKTFAIGYIDQRNWAIVRKEFTVNVPVTGYNDIDISSEHIIIEKEEKLFVVASGIGYSPLSGESSQVQMIYGDKSGALNRYKGNGAALYFNWTVKSIDSLYPFSEEVESLATSVSEVQNKANELYNSSNIIYDNTGNPYKLKIIDGNLVPVLQRFKKVIVLGNSVTKHGYSTIESTMWLSSDKGMAATIADNDFCHFIQEGLRTYFSDAEVYPTGIATWERTLDTNIDTINAFLPNIEGVDLVITAISENMVSTDTIEIQNAFDVLLNCIAKKYPNAEIVVTSTRLYKGGNLSSIPYKDVAMSNAAGKIKCKFIDVRQNKFDAFCSNFITGEWVPMFINGDSDIFPVQKAVYTHTSDIGMLRIANTILSNIGYSQIQNKIFNITVNANQDVYCPSYWVEKGLVTCFCYGAIPSSVVATSGDENIETRVIDFSTVSLYATPSKTPKAVIVFTMPNNNINLIIE